MIFFDYLNGTQHTHFNSFLSTYTSGSLVTFCLIFSSWAHMFTHRYTHILFPCLDLVFVAVWGDWKSGRLRLRVRQRQQRGDPSCCFMSPAISGKNTGLVEAFLAVPRLHASVSTGPFPSRPRRLLRSKSKRRKSWQSADWMNPNLCCNSCVLQPEVKEWKQKRKLKLLYNEAEAHTPLAAVPIKSKCAVIRIYIPRNEFVCMRISCIKLWSRMFH